MVEGHPWTVCAILLSKWPCSFFLIVAMATRFLHSMKIVDQPRFIPVKFGKIPLSGKGDVVGNFCQISKGLTDNGHPIIKTANLKPMAQVRKK